MQGKLALNSEINSKKKLSTSHLCQIGLLWRNLTPCRTRFMPKTIVTSDNFGKKI